MVSGGMAEWLMAAVLKTVDGETRSGVRIPLPPPAPKLSIRELMIPAKPQPGYFLASDVIEEATCSL
jgi:hypothetical protein